MLCVLIILLGFVSIVQNLVRFVVNWQCTIHALEV